MYGATLSIRRWKSAWTSIAKRDTYRRIFRVHPWKFTRGVFNIAISAVSHGPFRETGNHTNNARIIDRRSAVKVYAARAFHFIWFYVYRKDESRPWRVHRSAPEFRPENEYLLGVMWSELDPQHSTTFKQTNETARKHIRLICVRRCCSQMG